jgi:YHS domain-containing protein
MFRAIFEILLTVLVIIFIRAVMGLLTKGFTQTMRPGGPANPDASAPGKQVPLSGELKKDPVCGTYIATATSIKERVGGETYHFCSQECRDKYVASLAR